MIGQVNITQSIKKVCGILEPIGLLCILLFFFVFFVYGADKAPRLLAIFISFTGLTAIVRSVIIALEIGSTKNTQVFMQVFWCLVIALAWGMIAFTQ